MCLWAPHSGPHIPSAVQASVFSLLSSPKSPFLLRIHLFAVLEFVLSLPRLAVKETASSSKAHLAHHLGEQKGRTQRFTGRSGLDQSWPSKVICQWVTQGTQTHWAWEPLCRCLTEKVITVPFGFVYLPAGALHTLSFSPQMPVTTTSLGFPQPVCQTLQTILH